MRNLLVIAALSLVGCAGLPPRPQLAATAEILCAQAHRLDGHKGGEEVAKICAKREFAEAWLDLAEEAEALVKAQREGKARP
jgi:hypothetical protein